MSVLIKGMEMPSGCNTCQLRDLCFDYYVCRAKKLEDGRYLDIDDVVGRRHRYCPLVEIPAPHGRLIDCESDFFPTAFRHNSTDYARGWNACLRSVLLSSTIIKAEGINE